MAARTHDALVIGAGVAGLSAAHRLALAGLDVALVEARTRSGGRIWTTRVASLPTPVELGAEFVHGEPPEVLDTIRAAGIELVELEGDVWQFHDGALTPLDGLAPGVEDVMGRLERWTGEDVPFSEFLETHCRDLPAPARELAMAFVEGFHAAPATRVSSRALAEERRSAAEIDGDRSFRLVGGYGGLVRWLEAGLEAARVSIHFDARVTELRWRHHAVEAEVRSGTGERRVLHARKAVVTLPLGVLSLAPAATGAVRFVPEIPEKHAAAARLETGSVVKVIIQFRDALWETAKSTTVAKGASLAGLGFIVSRDPLFPTWWTSLPTRAPVLTAWAGGPAADRLAGLGTDGTVARALDSLSPMIGIDRAEIEARLESAHLHDWQADPFSRGAYSYEPIGGAGARRILASPVEGTLYFAGEATRFDGETGTVAAALATGIRSSGEILRDLDREARR